MSKIWPHDKIRELIGLAEATGEARATLASAAEAKLFRYAIYSWRRTNSLGWDIMATIDDATVVLTKKPEVHILQEAGE
jgi:hypothetical protein